MKINQFTKEEYLERIPNHKQYSEPDGGFAIRAFTTFSNTIALSKFYAHGKNFDKAFFESKLKNGRNENCLFTTIP
ncbi:MAG TPA: hypothetical protein VKY44_09970 [Flavobacterium sp.]|nr:hypothetical protein [Flavobacterium sp.]